VVADFVDVVIHLFESSQRMYYDIEALWRNGGRVEWRRPEDQRDEVERDSPTA
jgi:ribosomal silencing factor RsfS